MAQQLAHDLVIARAEIEEDLAGGMAEQVDVELEAEEAPDNLLDLERQRMRRLAAARSTGTTPYWRRGPDDRGTRGCTT